MKDYELNLYVKHSVEKALTTIASGSFSPEVIKSLLVDLRSYSPKKSILRELGDFLAHRDEKDQGIILDNVARTFAFVSKALAKMPIPTTEPCRHKIAPSFTDEGMFQDLLAVLKKTRIIPPTDWRLAELKKHRDAILVDILYLIQGVNLMVVGHRIPCFIGLSPDGTLVFNACLPSEAITGDEFIDIVFAVIATRLRAKKWIGHLPESNSHRTLFEFRVVDDKTKLFPIATVTSRK